MRLLRDRKKVNENEKQFVSFVRFMFEKNNELSGLRQAWGYKDILLTRATISIGFSLCTLIISAYLKKKH